MLSFQVDVSKTFFVTFPRATPEQVKQRLEQLGDAVTQYVIGNPEIYPSQTTTSSSADQPRTHVHAVITTRASFRITTFRKMWVGNNFFAPWASVDVRIPANFQASCDYAAKTGVYFRKELEKKGAKSSMAPTVVSEIVKHPSPQTVQRLIQEEPKLIYSIAAMERFMHNVQIAPTEQIYPRNVWYFYGESRSGKTWHAMEFLHNLARENGDPEEFDTVSWSGGFALGYTGSDYVLIDDWSPKEMSPEFWNRILDVYRTTVNMKYVQAAAWRAKNIVITRTHDPLQLTAYGLNAGELIQIVNRFKTTYLHVREDLDDQPEPHYISEEIETSTWIERLKEMQ